MNLHYVAVDHRMESWVRARDRRKQRHAVGLSTSLNRQTPLTELLALMLIQGHVHL